jgi:hypothetical protein
MLLGAVDCGRRTVDDPLTTMNYELALEQGHAFDSQVHIINSAVEFGLGLEVGGEDGGAEGGEGYADEAVSGEDERGLALRGDANEAAAAMEAGG